MSVPLMLSTDDESLRLRILRYLLTTARYNNCWSKPSTIAIHLGGSTELSITGAPDVGKACRELHSDKCVLKQPTGRYRISKRGKRVLACVDCALEDLEIFG